MIDTVFDRQVTPDRNRRNADTEWSENLDGFSTFKSYAHPSNKDAVSMLWHWLDVPILLSLIGISSAMVSLATKMVLSYDHTFKQYLLSLVSVEYEWPLYCLYSVCMALFACFLSQLICKESVGSGLADMKTILGGVVKPVLLSRRLIVAKALGLWLSLMAGLSVGKEGPYVHISGAVADQLMKLSPFLHIRRQDSKRLEILACACASGVSATFGNAFGGVLFSIEFTSSAYMVRSLPKAFLTSVVAMIAFLFFGVSDELSLFKGENVSSFTLPQTNELVVFFLIGVGGGLLGIFFVFLVELITTARNSFLDKRLHSKNMVAFRRYLLVGSVTLLVSSAMYAELSYVQHSGQGSFVMLKYLFGTESFSSTTLHQLCLFAVYKFIATLLSVTLPLPVGLFTPTFVTGGLLGRILGEVLKTRPGFDTYAPWEYALLGAAAFSTGVTRAISTAVIIFELACQPHLGLPISVVVLTAHFVGNRFTKNVYDVLMEANGGPYMDDLPPKLYTVPVHDVMMPIVEHHVLALDSSYRDAAELLEATEASHHGLDNHSSNGIYLEVGEVTDETDTGNRDNSGISNTVGSSSSSSYGTDGMDGGVNSVGVSMTSRSVLETPVRESVYPLQHNDIHSIQPLTTSPDDIFLQEHTPLLGANHIPATYNATQSTLLNNSTSTSYTHTIHTPHSGTPHTQYTLQHRRVGEANTVRKYYAPTVIPIVQSKGSMVIVGAVLRKDLQESLAKLKKFAEVAQAAPVILGRPEETHSGNNSNSNGNVPNMHTPIRGTSGQSNSARGSTGHRGNLSSNSLTASSVLRDRERGRKMDTSYLDEMLQFIIVTDDGRSIQPVVSAASMSQQMTSLQFLPIAVPLDPSPYQIVDSMHLSKVDMVFRLLSLNQAYVTNSGRLVGVVTRSLLRDYLGGQRKKPTDRVKKFCVDIFDKLRGKTEKTESSAAGQLPSSGIGNTQSTDSYYGF